MSEWFSHDEFSRSKRDAGSGEIVYRAPRKQWPRCGSCNTNATWVAVGPFFYEEANESHPRAAFGCESRRCAEQAEITNSWYWFYLRRPALDPQMLSIEDPEGLAHIQQKRWGPPFLNWLFRHFDLDSVPRAPKLGKKERFAVLERDRFTCQYCGVTRKDGAEMHVDHVTPRSAGGTHDPENLVTACADCNLGKGADLLR